MANPQLQTWQHSSGATARGYELDGARKVIADADVDRFEAMTDQASKTEAIRSYQHPENAEARGEEWSPQGAKTGEDA